MNEEILTEVCLGLTDGLKREAGREERKERKREKNYVDLRTKSPDDIVCVEQDLVMEMNG